MGLGIQRVYHLPLTAQDAFSAPAAHLLGLLHENDKTWADVEASLRKARNGEYDTIFFSIASIDSPHFCSAIFTAAQNNHRIVIQWTTSQVLNANGSKLCSLRQWIQDRGLDVLWGWIEDAGGEIGEKTSSLSREKLALMPADFATVLGTRLHDSLASARLVQALRPGLKMHFHFPVSTGPEDFSLSAVQVYDRVSELKFHFGKVETALGGENFDPRVLRSEGFEPEVEPEHLCTVEASAPEVSVIIPTFNNKIYVRNVLEHLARQDLPAERFEVVLVDDGSDDGTRESLVDFCKRLQRSFNFKYLYFPRSTTRSMGDLNFRAAVARNLGVRHADGGLLLFLDSDILLPADYLSNLIKLHQRYDVVQGARLELLQERSSGTTDYRQIDPNFDTYVVDGGYWMDFIRQPDWNAIPGGWKYTCTHSLSLKKDVFKKMGWLRKVFVGYGFEDSDLGFRLWKAGHKFSVNPQKVFHLYHSNQRSEFNNSLALKLNLLRNTARIFYFNTLEREVFDCCRFVFTPNPVVEWFRNLMARRHWAPVFKRKSPDKTPRQPEPIRDFFIELSKVLVTFLVTLAAPLEVSFVNPRHQRFWRPVRTMLRWPLIRFPLRLVTSPLTGVRALGERTRRESWRWRVLSARLRGRMWRAHAVYMRVRGQMWRLRTLYLRASGQTWRVRNATLQAYSGCLKVSCALRNAVWIVSKPVRKLYYFSRFQWADFLKAYREAQIESLLHRVRKLGPHPALEQVQSVPEDVMLFGMTFRKFFVGKKQKYLSQGARR